MEMFDIERLELERKVITKVIGVGKIGRKVVDCLIEKKLETVTFVVLNHDKEELKLSKAEIKIQINESLTKGSCDKAVHDTFLRDKEVLENQIKDTVNGTELTLIAADLGDTESQVATLAVAKQTRDAGCRLILGVVTKPSSSEDEKVLIQAEEEIAKLKEYVDTLIIVSKDKFKNADNNSKEVPEGYSYIENLLRYIIQGIVEVVNLPGIICCDFFDIYVMTKDKGTALIGVGYGKGSSKREDATKNALDNLLLETEFNKMKDLFVFHIGGDDAPDGIMQTAVEARDLANSLSNESSAITNIIFDDIPKEELIVLMIGLGVEDD